MKNRELPTIARATKHPTRHLQLSLWLRHCSITPSFQTATSASAADPTSTPALNSACNDVPAKVTVKREESVGINNDAFCAICWESNFFLPDDRSRRKSLASTAASSPLAKVSKGSNLVLIGSNKARAKKEMATTNSMQKGSYMHCICGQILYEWFGAAHLARRVLNEVN